jgi:hypothetical protein
MLRPDLDFPFGVSEISQRAEGPHGVEGVLQ